MVLRGEFLKVEVLVVEGKRTVAEERAWVIASNF